MSAQQDRVARVAVAGYFAILGFVCSAWVSSIDDLKVLLGLDASALGLLLMAGPCGNLVSFTFASALFARIGSRRGLILAVTLYLLAGLGIAASFLLRAPLSVWCGAIAALGGCGNLFNIAVNTQGGLVEKRLGRSIMNSFHGMFSVMCFAGGFLALGATACAIPAGARILASVLLAAVAHVVLFRLLPAEETAAAPKKKDGWHRPDRALMALGLAALVIMGCEGAISDWVGVFYRESLAAPATRVKWGFCAVMGLMTVGRFLSDRLIGRFGARRILHTYAVFVSCGLALALVSPYLPLRGLALHVVATTGFAVTGLGISALVPILYSKGNRTTCMPPASAITFLGSVGFLGYFAGPPLIGRLADLTSLSLALGVFAVLILACLFIDPERDA